MPRAAWYNENASRDYPFINRAFPIEVAMYPGSSSAAPDRIELPQGVVLDFGAIMSPSANYGDDDTVYLDSIQRDGGQFTFRFHTTAVGGDQYELRFTRQLSALENKIDWKDAKLFGTAPSGDAVCDTDVVWNGYLVTGDMTLLAPLISDGERLYFAENLWRIEPSRIQNLKDSYVRAVHLANSPRTLTEVPEGCSESSSSAENTDVIVQATCIDGDIKFKEGYNCTIRQDIISNSIIIGAGVGVGEGEPCDEVPLYDDETAPADSPYLSGGPGCGSILKALNGVTGRNITLLPGPGIRITPDPVVTNQLVISKAIKDFIACPGESEDDEASLSSSVSA